MLYIAFTEVIANVMLAPLHLTDSYKKRQITEHDHFCKIRKKSIVPPKLKDKENDY